MALTLIGSLIAILVVAAIVRALRLGDAAIADDSDAREIAQHALSGFHGDAVFLSEDRHAALVTGRDGDYALVKRHGAQFAVRRLSRPLNVERDGDLCHIHSGERLFGRVTLKLSSSQADKLLTMM